MSVIDAFLRSRILAVLVLLLGGVLVPGASAMGSGGLELREHSEFGAHLVTKDGASIYVFLLDEGGDSSCVGTCAEAWPPILVVEGEWGIGTGIDPVLVGTIAREDGGTQATYAGRPLYRFADDDDDEAGSIAGQGVNDLWFLVDPRGEPLLVGRQADAAPEDGQDLLDMEALLSLGQEVFSGTCATCHGARGGGGQGPSLDGNRRLADTRYSVDVVLRGIGYMPALGGQLSDLEVAAALTFVRSSWTNVFGPVLEEEVSAVR